jgi:hypothetical protein
MYSMLAQIVLIEIVLAYYWNICLKTSAYNSYQQQLQMDTQSVMNRRSSEFILCDAYY